MRRIAIATLAMILASSCTVTKYVVLGDYQLSNVEVEGNQHIANGVYDDDIISIGLELSTTSINIDLVNNAASSIKILWDEAAFIDRNEIAHRVIHLSTKLIEREKEQVPTVVPKGSRITDMLVPADYIEWRTVTKNTDSSGWEIKPYYQRQFYDSHSAAEMGIAWLTPMRLLLPIEYDGKVYEYTYTFNFQDGTIGTVARTDTAKTVGFALGVVGIIVLIEMLDNSLANNR